MRTAKIGRIIESKGSVETMYDQNTNPQPRRRGWLPKTVVALAAVGGLAVGAIYGPLVWQNAAVSAKSPAAGVYAPLNLLDSSMDEDQSALAALYDEIAPSVVNISVEAVRNTAQLPDIPGFQLPEGMPDQPQRGEGSGWIYDNDGHIVTNNHVVEDATKVVVNFSNGFWADAEVIATDPQADLAVIKVTPPEGVDWKPVNLAEDNGVKVGHTVLAMGNPFGLENTMTTGIVSALGRSFPVGAFGQNRYSLPDVIQTDAAINPGNSGGPLLNLNGELVGVNFAIESTVGSNSGVGFAIPVSIVKRVVPELISDGQYNYAYLGLQGNTISPELASALDLEANKLGVYVSSVVPGGPAEKGGVQGGSETISTDDGAELQKGGDIVTAIDDQPVRRFEDLVSYLVTRATPGQTVTLTVIRGGAEQKLSVELGERPAQPIASEQEGKPGQINARAAISIAEDAAKEAGMTGEVTEKVATPDQADGKDVWVVELSTDTQKATVTVDADSGEVINVDVQ
jgi:serine protease Do